MTNRYHTDEVFRRTVADMMADREMTGDLLLCGIWLARATILREPPPGEGRWSFSNMARDLYGQGKATTITVMGITSHVDNHLINRVLQALRSDIPRYDWEVDNAYLWHPFGGYKCAAPMIRRAGPCDRHTHNSVMLTDTSNGRVHVLAGCSRHKTWLHEQWRSNREERAALGDRLPTPAANAGGALTRHIHPWNWEGWWLRLNPDWTPPPEGAPTRKPTLSVLVNEEFEPSDDTQQPALRRIEGGWR